jgi:hypothetical protein
MPQWIFPLDPECPTVLVFYEELSDPILLSSGCSAEFKRDFTAAHRAECKRCQEYGAANCEVE